MSNVSQDGDCVYDDRQMEGCCQEAMEDFTHWGLWDAPNSKVSFYWRGGVWFLFSSVPHVEHLGSRALPHGCLESTTPLTIAA